MPEIAYPQLLRSVRIWVSSAPARRRSRYLYAAQSGGALYQPVLLGVRDDVEPAERVVAQLKLKAN